VTVVEPPAWVKIFEPVTSTSESAPIVMLPEVVAAPLTTNSASAPAEPTSESVPALFNPFAVTVVAALRVLLPTSNVPSLASVPPKVALLPPPPEEESTSAAP
jgi:hypothetical protein